ncbi:unnamed protein product [Rotaria socialis]|uniref:Uncharacterized protein n=2 Tax=Rotaria socialis TaxID=392032 RepID=A0A817Q8A6_9BILA|nr:unnamed protein product [Rotaria socialis]
MPKLLRRRPHSRNAQISLRRSRLLDKAFDHSNESSTESDEEEMKMNEYSFDMSRNFNDISDIFEICESNCSYKFINVLLYMSLRHFKIAWRDCDSFMKEIDAFQFCTDNRGGKRIEKFYEGFPELELEAKLFAIERSLNKSADFIVWDLANFVDQKYYELTNTTKDKNANFVQSIQLYHLDLRHWGFRFDSNSERPYFKGHERPEIITHCETLIKYFLEKKDHFYTISNDENPL